jgi:uncharacterized membrane protein
MWLPLGLLNAFFNSLTSVFAKRGTVKMDNFSIAWSQQFFSLFIFIPLLIMTSSLRPVSPSFWPALVATCILNVIAAFLFVQAVRHSDLSLVLPIVTLTPIFLLITSPLILGEFPKPLGLLGIIFTVAGSYVLNFSKRKAGILKPLTSTVKHKGPRSMLLVAFIWSISANLDKMALNNSNPILFAFSSAVGMVILLSIIMVYSKISFKRIFRNFSSLAPIGLSSGLSMLFQVFALSLTIVPNVISIKRTSAIFGVFWGKLFFKEENIKERLAGAAIMVLGVVLIALS